MSFLDDAADFVGDLFGSGGSTVVNAADQVTQRGDGFFGSSGFYSSLLSAGTTLAGIYFKQTGDKKLAEQAAKDRMAELEAAAKLKAGGGGGGGGGAGAAMKLAKMNNLAALYQNYADLVQKGGEVQSERAIQTGQLMQNPINARAAKL